MSTLQCDIVTPERKFFSDEAEFVVLPAAEGEMGMYEKHEPVVTTLKSGTVRVTLAGASEPLRFVVMGGYAEVDGKKVIILADRAANVAELDVEALKAELETLKDKLESMDAQDASVAFIKSEIEWVELQISQA